MKFRLQNFNTFSLIFDLNLLVTTQRQTLGSHRATGGALSTLNSDCEAHRGRRIKPFEPYLRAAVFLLNNTKDMSVNLKCEKWLTKIKGINCYFFRSNLSKSAGY